MYETLLVPVLVYGGRIRVLGLGLYRWKTSVLLGIRMVDKIPNARVRELCEMTTGVEERIDCVLR